MNCTELDAAWEEGLLAVQTDLGFAAAVGVLGVSSVAVLALGETIARPLAAVVAFAAGAGGLFVLTALVDFWSVPCGVRVGVAAAGGVAASLLAWCLLKGGLFVLGGAAVGSVTHFVYEAVPALQGLEPQVLGRPVVYYAAVGGAGVVGAVVAVCMKTEVLRLTTALVGGGGVGLAVHLVAERLEVDVPSLVLVALVLGASVAGVAVQYCVALRSKRRAADPR